MTFGANVRQCRIGSQLMAMSSPGPYVGCLLFLVDCTNGLYFLVNTGARVSIVPLSADEQKNRQEYSSHAANNSAIATFGECFLQLDLGLGHGTVQA